MAVSPSAQLELRAAANWYSNREPGLGEEFVAEVDLTLQGLAEGAHRHSAWRPGRPYRKVLVHRFPYVVFYMTRSECRCSQSRIAGASQATGFAGNAEPPARWETTASR